MRSIQLTENLLQAATFTPTPQTGMLVSDTYQIKLLLFPNGPEIGIIQRGEPFVLLYDTEIIDGWVWVEVKDQDGRIGWIPQYKIMYVTSTPTP